MKNSERFIKAYNEIAEYLGSLVGINRYMPFYRLVEMAKRKNGIVMEFREDLLEAGELRNAIVHDKSYPEVAIAEPHLSVVEKLEFIVHELMQPIYVIPAYERKVLAFKKTDSLLSVVMAVKKYAYSQFPVYDEGDKYAGLITDRSISRWVAGHADFITTEAMETASVGDLLRYESSKTRASFINQEKTVYDVKELYLQAVDKSGQRLEAVFITKTGKADVELLGLVTPRDLLSIGEKYKRK
ncbi:CBS domain-containing protein [Bacillus marinisedimentorum]|uniref:CBS domain-containing protein n=1 Tax=Bacillus marinisedimentorum TaxID=1821260 RepID=UPI000AC4247E|nr:CBS domain-containing protein [Bacillus marinisedimentorum]